MILFKKHAILLIFLHVAFGCQHSALSPQQEFAVLREATRPLPTNTVDVINFDKIVAQEKDEILIVNISDSTNLRTIYETQIPVGKRYHSIQLGRYVILEDRTTAYYHQSVIDMVTGEFLDLHETGGTSGATSVAPNDRAVLYNARFRGEGEFRDNILLNKIKTFDGQTKTVVDSVIGTLWAPNGKWFLASKRLGRDGKFVLSERVLYNRYGMKISLPSEQFSISGAVWSQDGSALAIPHAWNAIVTIIELEWKGDTPTIAKSVSNPGFSTPLLWSPDGQFLLYLKYHGDGHHTTVGNDIMLTDKTLSLNKGLIEHANIEEIPIGWTGKNGLITRVGDRLYQYQIMF